MGSSGTDPPAKARKASATEEQQPPATSSAATPAVYPDWSSFQGYPPLLPHGFFPSPAASSPQGHPYMWGAQPMIPPYGTPPPPYVMYPPGVYAHPSMPPGAHPFTPYAMTSPNGNADASGAAAVAETDGKASEGKYKSPTKSSKGSLGSLNMLTGKSPAERGKTSGALANGAVSQSGESGSESSSEGSEANSQNDSHHKGSGQEQDGDVRSSQNGVSRSQSEGKLDQTMAIMPIPSSGPITGPTTNLNIGMDYWGANTASSTPAIHGKGAPANVQGAVVPAEHWIQDERELKRQRRKQSNRESARRSRLRKQENASLRDEVNHIRKEYEELLLKNNSLKEKLGDKQHRTDDTGLDNKLQHSANDVQKKGN